MTEERKITAGTPVRETAQGALGAALDRPEGALKVTGRAPYAAEYRLDGLVHGVLCRASMTGRIVDHRRDRLESMPGVLMVLTDGLPRNPAQGATKDAPPASDGEAAYVGQPIALVVAETLEQAQEAALQYAPEIEPVSHDLDPETASSIDRPESNQGDHGDFDTDFSNAATRVDVTITTPSLTSAAMEPHAAIAEWDGDSLVLRGALQMLKFNRASIAEALGIPMGNVRVIAPYVGGGFGAKLGAASDAIAAARASRKLGRPVSVVLHRRQVFEATMRRSETRQRIRLGADDEGRITAIGHEFRVSNLPGEGFSEPVARADRAFYRTDSFRVRREIARIHRMAAGSVRAPGEAVGIPAFEMALDELAEAAGLDPVELRLRNVVDKDPISGLPFSSYPLGDTIRRGAEAFGWRHRPPRQQREGEWWIGCGMASAIRGHFAVEAEAEVTLTADGALVTSDQTDIGTGSYAVLGQVAGELLGLDPSGIEVRLGDTDHPPAWGSGGSAGAASSGTAVLLACRALRRRLAERLGVDEENLTLKDGQAIHDNRTTALAEILSDDVWTERGKVTPGDVAKKVRTVTCGAIFAEVAVSEITGEVRVRRLDGTFSAGRILNLKTARSQCHGGLIWGIGMALMEELHHDPRDGSVVNRDFAQFHIPANADVPQLNADFIDEPDAWAGPLGAMGIGELSISGAAGAILNAVHAAAGIRVRDMPATPDRVLRALDEAGP